jgi:hypothetical protein
VPRSDQCYPAEETPGPEAKTLAPADTEREGGRAVSSLVRLETQKLEWMLRRLPGFEGLKSSREEKPRRMRPDLGNSFPFEPFVCLFLF